MLDYNGNTLGTGDRIELHPATDLWMAGARFGTITKLGRSLVHVKLDRLAKVRTIHPSKLTKISR